MILNAVAAVHVGHYNGTNIHTVLCVVCHVLLFLGVFFLGLYRRYVNDHFKVYTTPNILFLI